MAVDRTSSAPSPDFRRPATRRTAWALTAVLFVFMLLNYADKSVVGLVGVDLLHDLGINAGRFGVVQSGFFWLYALGAILGGLLVGRVRARWLIGGIALLWALSLLPMVWSTSFGVLLATRMLLGFAEGPAPALALAVTHSWFPADKRTLPTSVVIGGTAFGPLIAAPVVTALLKHFDWHAAFAVTAVAGIAWVAVWLLVGREGPEEVGHAGSSFALLPEHVPYRRLLTSGTVIGLAVLFFATYCSVAVKITWLPLALRQGLGYDADTTGWLISLLYLCTFILMIAFGAVSRAMTKRGASVRASRGLLSCALVAAAGVSTVIWPFFDRGPVQIALLTVGTSLSIGAQGVAWSLLSDVVPARQRGTVIGTVVTFYSLGGVFAPLMLGGLVDDARSPLAGYRLGFVVLGIVLLAGAAVGTWLIRPERTVAAFASARPPVDAAAGPAASEHAGEPAS